MKAILGIVLVLIGFSIPILLAFLAPYLGGWYVFLVFLLMYLWMYLLDMFQVFLRGREKKKNAIPFMC